MKSRNLIQFVLLSIFYSCFDFTSNAQIVYTDLIPDYELSCNIYFPVCLKKYDLDLNKDGVIDFTINIGHARSPISGWSNYIHSIPLNGNAVKDTLIGTRTFAIPMNRNESIDGILFSQQSWDTTTQILKTSTNVGLWDSLSAHYLGLRLIDSGNVYYGWVRILALVNNPSKCIIKDYAYNSVPNQSILAGDTFIISSGLNEVIEHSTFDVFPNPNQGDLTIFFQNPNKINSISISDITGKLIYENRSTGIQKLEIKTKEFSGGLYFVRAVTGNKTESKKLIILK